MQNSIVWTTTAVRSSDLRDLVVELGGYWLPDPTLNQGVLERGDATVYLSVVPPECDDFQVALESAKAGLLEPPRSCVDIHIGHGRGSDALAEEVIQEIVRRWGGVLDVWRMKPLTC